MLYSLVHKNKTIGLFNDYNKCVQMKDGLISNKFSSSNDLTIVKYYDNSIMVCTTNTVEDVTVEETTFEDNQVIEQFVDKEPTEPKEPKELDSATKKKLKKKQERQTKIRYNLELLKQKKEKLEEKKAIYKIDYNLYLKFKKIKETNPAFELPELFIEKYDIMSSLETDGKLDFDNFDATYVKKNMSTSYNRLFVGETKEKQLLEVSEESPIDYNYTID